MTMIRRARLWSVAGVITLLLGFLSLGAGCGQSTLLEGVSLSSPTLTPDGQRANAYVDLTYTTTSDAVVSVQVVDQTGAAIYLRKNQKRSPGAHALRFNGAIPKDDSYLPEKRVLSDGKYEFIVTASDSNGRSSEGRASLTVDGADTSAPAIENLSAYPTTISPNDDAIDDVSVINYHLSKTSTVSVGLEGPDGKRQLLEPAKKRDPGEYKLVFAGKDSQDKVLPDGVYTYTVEALDQAGNQTVKSGSITIQGGGKPTISVTDVSFTPAELMIGGTITVTVKVKNTGTVTLRSQGPDPGYTYTTNDTFSSVENGKYAEAPGLWRIGVDWEGNTGSGPRKYPFRWGFGKDLAPGEEATITGHVTILQHEREMAFFVGVVQEGIGFPVDRVGRWVIQVGQ